MLRTTLVYTSFAFFAFRTVQRLSWTMELIAESAEERRRACGRPTHVGDHGSRPGV